MTSRATNLIGRGCSPAAKTLSRALALLFTFAFAACCLPAGVFVPSPASASFGFLPGAEGFSSTFLNEDGSPDVRAGSHPWELTTGVAFNSTAVSQFGFRIPDGDLKDLNDDLPAGVVGDPTATPRCTSKDFQTTRLESELRLGGTNYGISGSDCPAGTQVGVAAVEFRNGSEEATEDLYADVYNLVPGPGVPAELGFKVESVTVVLRPRVRTGSDYGLSVSVQDVSQEQRIGGTTVTLWGVPGDPGHDALRGECLGSRGESVELTPHECGEHAPAKPFLSMPTSCTGGPLRTTAEIDSWQNPGLWEEDGSVLPARDANGPLSLPDLADPSWVGAQALSPVLGGCERLDFKPSFSLTPDTTQADAPAGDSAIDLTLAQSTNPVGLATAQLREVTVSAPPGVTLNPGAADGLQACSDSQFAAGSPDPADCPGASAVGSVKIVTPLLESPLEGQVYVGAPGCSPCTNVDAQDGNLLRLFVQAQGSGVTIKATGVATANPTTGQLTVTFKELPQQPFSALHLTLQGGQRAVFINPLQCGPATLDASLTPWSSLTPTLLSTGFTVDWDGAGGACPAVVPFAPSFTAGTASNQAGAFSSLQTVISRPDRNQVLNAVSVKLPPGLLGTLANIPRCVEPQAAQGQCPAASRVATATVAAGTGGHPFWLSGPVYLTGPYEGAPFGLSVAVPVVAGPYNLGTVVTRARIDVDAKTAQVTVTSDPLPRIVDGIQTHIQTVVVNVDSSGGAPFTFNPTNCGESQVAATLSGTEGAGAPVSSRFQAANCTTLPFKPGFTATTAGKASKAGGASLDVKVTSKGGPQASGEEANIRSVKVDLPKQLPSRLSTLQKACLAATFEANPASCPKASVVGTATATTPILTHPLTGPAFLVSHGGQAFPDLEIVLQGEDITLILDGNTQIKKGITSSTFKTVPDAPINTFELKLPTGPYSILGTNLPQNAKYNLCGQTLTMPTAITGQNGTVIKQATKVAVSGCPAARSKAVKKGLQRKGHTGNAARRTSGVGGGGRG